MYILWRHITIDFMEGLTKFKGKDIIIVVEDRFIKDNYFIVFTHAFIAKGVAEVFLNHFYRFHGLLMIIDFDRDKVFTILFWKKLIRLLGVKFFISSIYHP